MVFFFFRRLFLFHPVEPYQVTVGLVLAAMTISTIKNITTIIRTKISIITEELPVELVLE